VQYWNINANVPAAFTNGGPTDTLQMDSTAAPTVAAGDPAICPVADARFFAIPAGSTCDVGSEQFNGAQETTGPTCNTFNIITGPPKQQQVFVTDGGTGMGPEAGAVTDASPTLAIGAPPISKPVSPADAITDVVIDNGTVALSTPFAAPSRGQMTVTATKGNQSLLTHWNFTAWNWAGVKSLCS
jgi:hypothetical protein